MNELALFAGAGGGILGGKLLGWRTRCAVEIDPYARKVLLARQRDGTLKPFPIWDDVTTFDGHPWRGSIDVVSGGFPCQDISSAGKGGGIDGARSGLWAEMARIVGEVQPGFVFVENSPLLTSRGLDRVLGDLAALGYDARWGVFSASSIGAPHTRERLWIVAYARSFGRCGLWQQMGGIEKTRQRWQDTEAYGDHWHKGDPADGSGIYQSRVGRVADGVANRLDRLRTIGNGQVPAVARLAWETLTQGLKFKEAGK